MGRRADPPATGRGASAPWSLGLRAVPTEQLPDLPPNRPERAGHAGGALRWVTRGDPLHQPREVIRATRRRQRPHVLQPEVAGELVDPPGPGGVRGVREPHSWTSIHSVAADLSGGGARLIGGMAPRGPRRRPVLPCPAHTPLH